MAEDMDLPRYSASRVDAYLRCPRQFAFKYVERIPPESRPASLALGRAVHSAIEWMHMELMDGQKPDPRDVVRTFYADWEAELDEGPLSLKSNESTNLLRHQGQELVFEYAKAYMDKPVVAAEVPFTVPLVDPETGEVFPYLLHGYFDALWSEDRILEIKTAARRFDEKTLARKLQLTSYAYAYRQLHARDPTLLVVQLLKTRRPEVAEHEVHRDREEDAWFVHLVVNVARGVEAGAFAPRPDWACNDCSWANACREWRGERRRSEPEPIGSILERVHLPVF